MISRYKAGLGTRAHPSSSNELETRALADDVRLLGLVEVLGLEEALEVVDLEDGGEDEDADLKDGPPDGREVDAFGLRSKTSRCVFPLCQRAHLFVEFDLLLLHVIGFVEDFCEFVIQLDDLDLQLVHVVLRGHLGVVGIPVAPLHAQVETEHRVVLVPHGLQA